MASGVIGNTRGPGPRESRFEPSLASSHDQLGPGAPREEPPPEPSCPFGDRSTAGHGALDPGIRVRVLVPEPPRRSSPTAEAARSKRVRWGFKSLLRYRPTGRPADARHGGNWQRSAWRLFGCLIPLAEPLSALAIVLLVPNPFLRPPWRSGFGRVRAATSVSLATMSRTGPRPRLLRMCPTCGGHFPYCPNAWHEHRQHGNPRQEHSRRTSPARPSTELPGRAVVEARRRAKALGHKARQGKARR